MHGILSDDQFVRHVQSRLRAAGFDPGPIDGIGASRTLGALGMVLPPAPGEKPTKGALADDTFGRLVQSRLVAGGFYAGPVDGIAGPMTLTGLDRAFARASGPAAPVARPPWIDTGLETLGWHEVRDNARLRAWLKRDGATLGDPAALPWCGDWVATALRIALPGEPFQGTLGQNPYWALNWRQFGARLDTPAYGCIGAFHRPGGGHVGFLVGYDSSDWYVLGGNQGNTVSVTRIDRDRLDPDGLRWPSTWRGERRPLPEMSPGSIPKSINEF